MNWIDNADSYICPACGQEVSSPANVNFTCPKCGFVAKKDKPVVSKAMSEQRLIDANAAKKSLFSYYSFVNGNTIKANYTGETLMSYEVADMIEDCVDNTPTIDPETLPIVRELREKLERVTRERDEARRDCAVAEKNHAKCEGKLYKTKSERDEMKQRIHDTCILCRALAQSNGSKPMCDGDGVCSLDGAL